MKLFLDPNDRPDAIYWRRNHHGEPDVEYARLENLILYPGPGPSVDGYVYWLKKGSRLSDGQSIVKRITLQTWIQWGRRIHAPPKEKGDGKAEKSEQLTRFFHV